MANVLEQMKLDCSNSTSRNVARSIIPKRGNPVNSSLIHLGQFWNVLRVWNVRKALKLVPFFHQSMLQKYKYILFKIISMSVCFSFIAAKGYESFCFFFFLIGQFSPIRNNIVIKTKLLAFGWKIIGHFQSTYCQLRNYQEGEKYARYI